MPPVRPKVGLSLQPEPEFLAACLPLLAEDELEALEWSFDTVWASRERSAALEELIDLFGQSGWLLGHGVDFSVLSTPLCPRRRRWLDDLSRERASRPYRHISEHFGFSTTPGWQRGAPLPVPLTRESLAVGRGNLERLAEAAGAPVGLENLAFAFGRADVERQGEFLDRLLEPTAGFLVLDIHNIYCQLVNFELSPDWLLSSYPLERVRELHVSGGSWSEAIRRDTHDGPVPPEVFDLVPLVLRRCPRVEAVILECVGHSLQSADSAARFVADFRALKELVRGVSPAGEREAAALPERSGEPIALESGDLATFQHAMLDALAVESDPAGIHRRWLDDPRMAGWHAHLERYEPRMVAIAAWLVKKWGVRQTPA